MTRLARVSIGAGGALIAALLSVIVIQQRYAGSELIYLLLPAVVAGAAIIARPEWGLYLVILLSPLQNFGNEILMITRLVGVFVTLIILARVVFKGAGISWTGLERPVIVMVLGISLSFFRTSATSHVALTILSLVSLYGLTLLIYTLVQTRKDLERFLMVFLASGIYPIWLALFESLEPQDQTFTRVSGTFTLPTGLGAFLLAILMVGLIFAFYARDSIPKRLFGLSIFTGGLSALFLTLSRGSIFGVLIGMLFVFIPLLDQIRRSKITLTIVFFASMVIAWMLWPSLQGRVINPVVDFFGGRAEDTNIVGRRDELAMIIPITLDNQFMGTGVGNYIQEVPKYRARYGLPELPFVPHNILLYFFGEVGIIGAVGFLWMMGHLFTVGIRSYRMILSMSPGLEYYVFIGAVGSGFGFLFYLLTHGGLFQNEIWIVVSLLLISIRLAKQATAGAQPLPADE